MWGDMYVIERLKDMTGERNERKDDKYTTLSVFTGTGFLLCSVFTGSVFLLCRETCMWSMARRYGLLGLNTPT